MNTILKNRIMRRVYMVYYLRRVLSPVALKFYAAGIIGWAIAREVWVAKVIENAPGTSLANNFNFFASAVWNAELLVQALVLGLTICALWLLRDIFSPSQRSVALI